MNARTTRAGLTAGFVCPWLACLLCSGLAARAGIILTNFTGTNVIRILPVGDSITDDCEVEGAWRKPLQPLLDSNQIPFIFIGRNSSTETLPSFTKTKHEGYCGAVVAPPGVYGAYSYLAVNNYTEKTVYDALHTTAVTNPNVVLVLIGANDIGQGRDPIHTASIDMTNLLNLILTNVPNANVIFTKITSLSNASLGYSTYATNVPIYNNALEQMVNQKRAESINVTLADMFSVNPYGTAYYLSDHLHANAAGLSNMAAEWYSRIQTLITGTNQITAPLINAGAIWTYSDTGTYLGTNWSQPSYDDSAWASAPARFGYGEPVPTTVSFGGSSTNVHPTTYFRTKFVVPWNENFTNLSFRLSQTGGAVVWLNGVEAYRTNLPAGPITYSTLATGKIGNENEYILFRTNLALTLPTGTNVIAVEIHQSALTNPNLGFDFELLGGASVLPNPTLTATFISSASISLAWPLTNGSAFTLYSSATLVSPNWQAFSPSLLQTNHGQITAAITPGPSSSFFRLQLSQ